MAKENKCNNPGCESDMAQDNRCHAPEMYSEKEMRAIEKHIEKSFGSFKYVIHEIVSPDIHVDICIVEPSKEHDFYTLVTMGMGAHKMNVPPALQKEYDLQRAEIMVTLPQKWDLKSDKEEFYWPLRWLKILARLPIDNNTWLGYGHTVPNGGPFADNTELSGVALYMPYTFKEDDFACLLPDGGKVNFYQMLPLYEEEMNYKLKKGDIDALFDKFDDKFTHVVDIKRKNYLK